MWFRSLLKTSACYLRRRQELVVGRKQQARGLFFEGLEDRWRPPFISALAAEDRCHLNGLAMVDSRPGYVSAVAATDTADGWRRPGLGPAGTSGLDQPDFNFWQLFSVCRRVGDALNCGNT